MGRPEGLRDWSCQCTASLTDPGGTTVSDESRMVRSRSIGRDRGRQFAVSTITSHEEPTRPEHVVSLAGACDANCVQIARRKVHRPSLTADTLMPDCCTIRALYAVGPWIASPDKRVSFGLLICQRGTA